MADEMNRVSVYVDGSCKGNPGPGGWGFYVIYDGASPHSDENTVTTTWSRYGGKDYTTNNEMELTAMYMGLDFVITGHDITVYADTQYGLKGLLDSTRSLEYLNGCININKLGDDAEFTGWIQGWVKNGWKKTTGGPVANKSLWENLMKACRRHILGGSVLRFVWVKGHSGIDGNERADRLADRGASLYKR